LGKIKDVPNHQPAIHPYPSNPELDPSLWGFEAIGPGRECWGLTNHPPLLPGMAWGTVATLEASSTTAKSHRFLGIEWENDLTKKKTFRGNRV